MIFVPEPPAHGQRYTASNNARAILIHIPGLGAPSEASTLAWLKALTSSGEHYFEDDPHIILDSLHGHFADDITEAWSNIGATTHKLPATLGRWLNPCDQAINREMRREFLRLQMHNRNTKLDNIVRAYYSITEDTVKNSFKKCGLFGGDPEEVIENVAAEGYRATGDRQELLESCERAFATWATTSSRRRTDVLPRTPQPAALDCALDGRRWTAWGSSRSHLVLKKS